MPQLAQDRCAVHHGRPYRRAPLDCRRGATVRPHGDCRAGRVACVADDEVRRARWASTTTSRVDRCRRARPLAHHPAFADSDGPLMYRATLHRRPRPGRRAPLRVSTASSTRPTCGSTAPTSATPRATSSPTPSTSPTLARLGDGARARGRGGVRAPRRPHGEAQHHRRPAALRTARPGVEPRRPVATGAARATGAGAHRPLSACCAATPTSPSGHLRLQARLDSDGPAPVPVRTTVDGE